MYYREEGRMMISLRLSDEDLRLIQSYAKLKKQSVSEVMRTAIMEQIESEYDLTAYEKAMEEQRRNPVTYSLDEAEKELGLK
jgi:Arc/MetJ-type ribon-helix-helix transcriptional regulator